MAGLVVYLIVSDVWAALREEMRLEDQRVFYNIYTV